MKGFVLLIAILNCVLAFYMGYKKAGGGWWNAAIAWFLIGLIVLGFVK